MQRIKLTLDLTEYEAALLLEKTITSARRPGHETERREWVNMAMQMADRLAAVPEPAPSLGWTSAYGRSV